MESISAQTGAAILSVHHTGKGRANEHSAYSSRGTSLVSDGCRFMWGLKATEEKLLGGMDDAEKARYVSFKLTKNNYGPAGRVIHFRRNDDGFLEEVDLRQCNQFQSAVALCGYLASHDCELTENELLKESAGKDIREALKTELGVTRDGLKDIVEYAKEQEMLSIRESSGKTRGRKVLHAANWENAAWA